MKAVFEVFWTIVSVLVILFVFGQLNDRFQTIVVAILGMIYAQIRVTGSVSHTFASTALISITREIEIIKTMIDHGYSTNPDIVVGMTRKEKYNRNKLWIEVIFFLLIELICFWKLFTVL